MWASIWMTMVVASQEFEAASGLSESGQLSGEVRCLGRGGASMTVYSAYGRQQLTSIGPSRA